MASRYYMNTPEKWEDPPSSWLGPIIHGRATVERLRHVPLLAAQDEMAMRVRPCMLEPN